MEPTKATLNGIPQIMQTHFFSALAQYLANVAADNLEPDAGQPINETTRKQFADGFMAILEQHTPALINRVKA